MATSEGALTVTRLVDEILDSLHGYVRDQSQATSLSAEMASGDLTFVVDEYSQVSRGLVEIDEELIYVSGVSTAGAATVMPWGRAQNGTTAAAHTTGTKVVMSPLYPRRRVQDAVFGTLREIFPQVYGVSQATLDVTPARTNYTLPSDCFDVLSVESFVIGPSQMWLPMRRWRVNRTPTAVELEVLGGFYPGNDMVRVNYITDLPADLSITSLTELGYTQHVHDLVVLGATARLLMQTEPSRLQVRAVEASGRAEAVPAGSITKVANNLYSMFLQRARAEADRLQQRYPPQPHFVR